MFLVKSSMFFLIFLISTYIGFIISRKYSNRVRDLKEIKNCLNVFKRKVMFTYEPIPEIFGDIAKNSEGEVHKLFLDACNNIETTVAGEAWRQAVDASESSINQEDKEVLKALSKLLGKTDLEGQTSEIDLTMSFLDTQIEKAEKESAKNAKLYKTLGIMAGLGIVIILL